MWKVFFNQLFERQGGSLILECDLYKRTSKQYAQENTFINKVLTSWMTIKQKIQTLDGKQYYGITLTSS